MQGCEKRRWMRPSVNGMGGSCDKARAGGRFEYEWFCGRECAKFRRRLADWQSFSQLPDAGKIPFTRRAPLDLGYKLPLLRALPADHAERFLSLTRTALVLDPRSRCTASEARRILVSHG